MHRYECGNCNLVSEPYMTRNGAEQRGKTHRETKHDGMHPLNEAILNVSGRMPQTGEWKLFAILAVLLVAGLISKAL